ERGILAYMTRDLLLKNPLSLSASRNLLYSLRRLLCPCALTSPPRYPSPLKLSRCWRRVFAESGSLYPMNFELRQGGQGAVGI
ncbi:hypothetical protein, partial [Candidatus Regiella insecticola]|uniref:hypothetical protein n=1 Tax=Candidatus Regiella insecticola TaxID=138073 RepID=UPI001ED937BB